MHALVDGRAEGTGRNSLLGTYLAEQENGTSYVALQGFRDGWHHAAHSEGVRVDYWMKAGLAEWDLK